MKPREIRNMILCFFQMTKRVFLIRILRVSRGEVKHLGCVHPLGLFSSPEGSGKEMDGKEKTKDRTECVWVCVCGF